MAQQAKSKKILIIGANGQLSQDLIKTFQAENKYKVSKSTRKTFDITKAKKTKREILKINPNIIINTAAFHNTQECEKNPKKSFETNSMGAYNVSKAASQINAKIVYISTDYVFDGNKKIYYEKDNPNPLNIYGASKLLGEHLTKIANPNNYLIIRTSWLYGEKISNKGYNFVTLILQKSKKQNEISVVNDQFGCPTFTKDLALKIKELIDKDIKSEIFHLTNEGHTSWFGFAKKILEFKKIKSKLVAVPTQSKPTDIKRPKYSILKSRNLKRYNIKSLRGWKYALKEYINLL